MHFSAGGVGAATAVGVAAQHFELDGGGVLEAADKVKAMGAACKFPVNRCVERIVRFALAFGVHFHLAEVTVRTSFLAGDVVDIVYHVHVLEVISEDGGVALVDFVGPFAVVDGGEVAIDGFGGVAT